MVAVPVAPPQHSPILGQRASWQTVAKELWPNWVLRDSYLGPRGACWRSHGGLELDPADEDGIKGEAEEEGGRLAEICETGIEEFIDSEGVVDRARRCLDKDV